MEEIGFTRRWMLGTGAVAGAVLSAPPSFAKSDYDPRKTSLGQVKLEAYADGRPAPWWYIGTIYAVRERTRPVPLFRFEGSETYWARPKAGGDAEMSARTLTFFRDLKTGQWLDTFANPLTGKTNDLRPNLMNGDSYFPADGAPPRPLGSHGPTEISPQGSAPPDPSNPIGSFQWIVTGDMILRIGDRGGYGKLQPGMEAQSTFGDARAFFDPKVRDMDARFSSTTLTPFMGWMNMADEPGHLVWHASGRKLKTFDELPRDYRDRAEKVKPGQLTAPHA